MLPGNRVVVVGMGALTPIGNNVEDFWQSLLNRCSGIERISHFDPTGLKSQVAGMVKGFNPLDYLSEKKLKRVERGSVLALAAVREAVNQCALPKEVYQDTGLLVGSNICALDAVGEAYLKEAAKGPRRVTPELAQRGMPNAHTGVISIEDGFQGGGFAPASACATGGNAIGEAFMWVRYGKAPFVVSGGVESAMEKVLFASFGNLGALSTRFNEDPTKASRPYDAKRDGFAASEGAGVLILTTVELAKKYGMTPQAEIIGYGTSYDASDMTNPTGEGFALAIRRALESAEVAPEDVDYVNAHGTSTPPGDIGETIGIKLALGEKHAHNTPVSSNKSQIGHTMGGAGAIESIAVIRSLQTGTIPATINLDYPDPECDLDYVADGPRITNPRIVLKNSFGFGGNNACLIFKRWEE